MRKRFLIAGALCLAPTFAMAQSVGFTPCASASLSVSGTSSNVQLSKCGPTIKVWNTGTQEVFIAFGATSSVAATTSNDSIPGATGVVYNVGLSGPFIAAITSTSTSTLRISSGYGDPGLAE